MATLDPFGHPTDPFLRTIEEALREYTSIAKSHAVESWKKERMLYLVRQIELLVKQPSAKVGRVRSKIDELMDDLMALSPVPARPGMTRIPNVDDVRPRVPHWELVRVGNQYHVRVPGQAHMTLANGEYVFAILMSHPWEVRLGERAVGGHTAVTRGADVYFAGQISFTNGVLVEWDNDSGHYRPPSGLSQQVQALLPLTHYKRKV